MNTFNRSGARRVVRALALALSLALPLGAQTAEEPPPLPLPLTLDAALDYAFAHNPNLRRVQEQIREQEGVLVEVRSARLPTLAASGGYNRIDDRLLESSVAADRSWSVSATVSQLLYSGGGPQARVRGQREQLEAARLAFQAVLNDTLLAVRQQFYGVLLDRELIGVQEEAITVLETELANARHRRDAGSGSDFDVLRAEVAVANARPALIRARNDYRVAQDRLRSTLGAAAPQEDRITDLQVTGELALPVRSVALVDAVTQARAQRPELQQQARLLSAAEQGVKSARSGYQPTVSAVAGYEVTKPSLVTSPRHSLDGWTAGVQASWNIFDGRATAGRVAQARSRVNQTEWSARELSLAVEVEVRRAHASLIEATELLASSEQVVTQARESLRLAQARFGAGTATQLDVLSAQSALTAARSNLAQAQHDYAVALATLQRATGDEPALRLSS